MQGCFSFNFCLLTQFNSLSLLQWAKIVGWPTIESSSSALAPWFTQDTGVAWATLASITLWSPIVHLFEGLYRWAFKPPSLPWYMVDSDPREGQYSIVGWNMLLCAHTRPKEVLVLSLGSFHIRRNYHLLACGPGKGLFSISRNVHLSSSSARRRRSSRRKKHAFRHLWLVQSWISQNLRYSQYFLFHNVSLPYKSLGSTLLDVVFCCMIF